MAVEFSYRYGQYYHGVHWIRMGDSTTVATEVIACGEAIGLPVAELPQHEVLAHIRRVWSGPESRLLIFDNCEDPSLLAMWRPSASGVRVLVTSRRTVWPPEYDVITYSLDPLPRDESLRLIRAYVAQTPRVETDVALARVADALGDLPLALALAGHYLARYRSQTINDYLEALAVADDLVPVGRGTVNLTGHELSVRRTFAVSYDRLQPATNDDGDETAIKVAAVALLACAACFAPGEPIPGALLVASLAADPPTLADEARERLLELGLLELSGAGDESYRLHLLLARFVTEEFTRQGGEGGEDAKEEKKGPERMAAAQAAVEEVIELALGRANDSGDPRSLRGAETQLRHVVDRAAERKDRYAALLCNRLGYYLYMSGDPAGALLYFKQALVIHERVLGQLYIDLGEMAAVRAEAHQTQLRVMLVEGMLAFNEGDHDRARREFGAALEQAAPLDAPDLTAQAHEWLAATAIMTGDVATAETHGAAALDYYKRTGNRVKLEGIRADLAGMYLNVRQFERVIEPSQRALRYFEEIGHERWISSISSNLAEAYLELGRLDKALTHAQRVLQLGNPYSRPYALYTLGLVHQRQGRPEYAAAAFEDGLRVARRNRDVYIEAFLQRNLGRLHRAQGRSEEAAAALSLALDLFRRMKIASEIAATESELL